MARENLTNKQRAFVEAYLANGFNATQAAITAGYSEKTAYSIGQENLKKPEIAEFVKQRMDAMAMQADEVLARLSDMARGNMSDFVTILSGLPYIDLDKAKAQGKLYLLKKFKNTDKGVEIELYDAQAALVQLGRHHGLFTDKTDITSGGEPIKTYISVSPDDWDADDS